MSFSMAALQPPALQRPGLRARRLAAAAWRFSEATSLRWAAIWRWSSVICCWAVSTGSADPVVVVSGCAQPPRSWVKRVWKSASEWICPRLSRSTRTMAGRLEQRSRRASSAATLPSWL